MKLWCRAIHRGEGQVGTWQLWGQAQQGPAGSPGHSAGSTGCLRVLMHFPCWVLQAQAGSPRTGLSSRECRMCGRQAKACWGTSQFDLLGRSQGRIRAHPFPCCLVPKQATSQQIAA